MNESKKEKELKEQIAKLQAELVNVRSNKTVLCQHCKKRTRLSKATAIRCYHYIAPYGCTGGDYWTFSHEYSFYCAKCESFNRAYVGSWDKLDWSEGVTITNTHPKSLEEYRVHTYFLIDEHFRLFGEKLNNYKYGNTIEEIREANKE